MYHRYISMDLELSYLIPIAVAIVAIFLLTRGVKQPSDEGPEDPELSFMEFIPQMEP